MMNRSAVFSPDRRYRYSLLRVWDFGHYLTFCMLNPSTADETVDDPTVSRCIERAKMGGFAGLIVVNLFALRSTDPRALYSDPAPIGPDNDLAILKACSMSKLVICGWGKHGALMERGQRVLKTMRDSGFVPHALKQNLDGSPAHPLYIGYDVLPWPLP